MVKEVNNFPKISVVVPSYNKAGFIRLTLESVVSQNYQNFEVIIQDGGSTDGTVDIIKEFAEKYPAIIKWVSKQDEGQLDAIDIGLKKATGEVLAFINADDVYQDNCFLEIGRVFRDNPNIFWVTGYGDIINQEGKRVSSWVTMYKNLLLKINCYWLLLMVNYITQPATFIRKDAYHKYGPFMGTKKFVMEYELWLRLGKVQMPKVIQKNLASFRLTMDNISATSFKELLSLDNQLVKKYTDNLVILRLHNLHNQARVRIISLLKRQKNETILEG